MKKQLHRVLVACLIDSIAYLANQVINILPSRAESSVASGQLDPSPAGVEYALQHEGAAIIEHDVSADVEQQEADERAAAERKAQEDAAREKQEADERAAATQRQATAEAIAALSSEIAALEVQHKAAPKNDKAAIAAEIEAKQGQLATLGQA